MPYIHPKQYYEKPNGTTVHLAGMPHDAVIAYNAMLYVKAHENGIRFAAYTPTEKDFDEFKELDSTQSIWFFSKSVLIMYEDDCESGEINDLPYDPEPLMIIHREIIRELESDNTDKNVIGELFNQANQEAFLNRNAVEIQKEIDGLL